MLCYCKSLEAFGSCVSAPKVIAGRLPIFYGLLEALIDAHLWRFFLVVLLSIFVGANR